jgi:hypothetical protein
MAMNALGKKIATKARGFEYPICHVRRKAGDGEPLRRVQFLAN